MSRKDIGPIVAVVLLVIGWAAVDRLFLAPRERQRVEAAALLAEQAATNLAASVGSAEGLQAAGPQPVEAPAVEARAATDADATPERTFELQNDRMLMRLSSRGAAVEHVVLKAYPRSLTNKVDRVELDFSNHTAMAYGGLPGLSDQYNFLPVEEAPDRVVLERQRADGLTLRRTYTMGSNYVVAVRDELSNRGATPVTVSEHSLRTGYMGVEEGHRNMIGFTVLGVDSLSGGGEGVQHWGSELAKWFGKIQKMRGLPVLPQAIDTAPLDDSIREPSVDWIAAKNKYFVQIIAPAGGADGCKVLARRVVPEYEKSNPAAAPGDAEVAAVGGLLEFRAVQTIQPGEALAPRAIDYYVGPKKYNELRDLRRHQVDVMELGYWQGVGKILLAILIFLHDHVIQNYGIAIMLLTFIVRTVFWPLTHKSTISMKKMTKLQPQVMALREKYKTNPQKMQMEMMALYRQYKVNPLAGCLPMIIQIPVFIALFVILRSAIELRYASFLWIRDLSEPERIFDFGFTIPLLGWDALNLLPLLMAGTMWLQMKLTPTAGDPQQQKIMMIMMPIMMVFMLYGYASGLALYWTTTNVISIVQQLYYRRLNFDLVPEPAAAPAPAPAKKKSKRA